MEAREVADQSASGAAPYAPKFFAAHDWATLRVLADMIIPATSAAAPRPTPARPSTSTSCSLIRRPRRRQAPSNAQTQMRGGLAWLDRECAHRFSKTFVAASESERKQVLDDIAWPAKAKPEHAQGVAFFNRARDMIAAGFFSSKMGVKDVRYIGKCSWRSGKAAPRRR